MVRGGSMRRGKWGSRPFGVLKLWSRTFGAAGRGAAGLPALRRRPPAFKSRRERPERLAWSRPSPGFRARARTGFSAGRRKQAAGPVSGAKPRVSRSRRRFWLIFALLLLLGVLQGIRYVEKHLKPPIVHLAQIRVKQIATESINKAITSQVAGGESAERLIDWKTDSAGKISGFMLNYSEHMRITSEAAEVIQSTLQQLHNRTERIPLGQALGSPLIASFGPSVPVKIEPQGAVKVELNTRQQNAGINMILVEVYIHIVTEVAVVIPFDMEPQIVDTEIPVSYLMVVGDVPMYYYDNQGRPVGENSSAAPGIAIPAPSPGAKPGETAPNTAPAGGSGETPAAEDRSGNAPQGQEGESSGGGEPAGANEGAPGSNSAGGAAEAP